MGGSFVPGLPSQALRASSPKGGASGVPVKFTLDEKAYSILKQECPATEGSSFGTMFLVKLL